MNDLRVINLSSYTTPKVVEYKNKEGIIDIDSIGDINTKLLPPKAFVKNINPSLETININLDDENYTIIMNLE